MKKFYVLSMILAMAISGWSQATYYWQPNAGGDWTIAANWSTTPTGVGGTPRTTPASTDILIIDKGTTMTITNIPTQTIGRLSILTGSVTLSGPTLAQTLTIANGTGNDFVIANGATMIQASSLENILLSAAGAADISGTYRIDGNYSIGAANTVTTAAAAILCAAIIPRCALSCSKASASGRIRCVLTDFVSTSRPSLRADPMALPISTTLR